MAYKHFPVKVELDTLKGALGDLFTQEEYSVNVLPAQQGFTLEAKKSNPVRDWTGLSASVTVTAQHTQAGTGFDVEVGRVADKVGLGVIFGAITLAGAAIPAYGYYAQHKTRERVWEIISDHVRGAPPPA